MPKSNVKIIGDKELLAKFKKLDRVAQRQQLITAATAGILPIQNEAIRLAPKKESNLARSIHTEIIEESNDYVEAATGTDVAYARRREFGFDNVDSLGRKYNDPPQPYMRPAYDRKRKAAIVETQDVLEMLINGAAA